MAWTIGGGTPLGGLLGISFDPLKPAPAGTDSRAQRYRTFSNVNQAFAVKSGEQHGLKEIVTASSNDEVQFGAIEGINRVRLKLNRAPNGRIIVLDSSGFQRDFYLRKDEWSFYSVRGGIIVVRFI